MNLNVGSGFVKGSIFEEGWVNVDFAYEAGKPEWQGPAKYLKFDINNKWPLEDGVADCAFMSHVLEHIEYTNLLHVIKECYRVLKKDHPVRIICPDPRIFIENWKLDNSQFLRDCYGQQNYDRWNYENNRNMAFSDMFFGDHYAHTICPSISMIAMMLMRVGFEWVMEMAHTNTEFPQYFGTDQPDGWGPSVDNRPVMSWRLEAVK